MSPCATRVLYRLLVFGIGGFQFRLNSIVDGEQYVEASELWLRQVENQPHSAKVIANAADFIVLGVTQVTLGPAVGIAIGLLGAYLIDKAATTGRSNRTFEGMAVLALALLSFAVAEAVGGNGFIATFAAGLSFGAIVRNRCASLFEFMETEGQLLTLLTFFVFGALMIPEALPLIDAKTLLYAILSLTVIRMLPVALSLLGSGVGLATHLFLGWFGPRGLASILFALLIIERSQIPHRGDILAVTVATVALSVILHGVTAAPFAKRYGALTDQMGKCEEKMPVVEMPLRHGNRPEPDQKI